ncbi:MAG: endonuclease V [Nitrospinota bacterium]
MPLTKKSPEKTPKGIRTADRPAARKGPGIRTLHPWRASPAEARAIQERLRGRLTLRGAPRNVHLIAGADLSYPRFSSRAVAGVVVLSWPDLEVVETRTVDGEMEFPYVPGLLSFREGPLLLRAFERLRARPQLIFFDGQGIAHPRGFGLASHMGLILDRPSLGCAKSLLFGRATDPGREAGGRTPIHDLRGRRIGVTLRTRTGVKPIFVSPGHRIGMDPAADWALRACRGYRVPEPTRQAHLLVNRRRREIGLDTRNREKS